VQGRAVVAVTVRADPNQPSQPALKLGKLPDLLADRRELCLGGPDDVVGTPAVPGSQQVADLPEGEPKLPGPPDEVQPLPVVLGILTEPRPPAFRQRQQSPALIEPHGLDADPCSGGELSDRQPCHVSQASSRTAVRSQPNSGASRPAT
jgi:hypothetical protein